MVREEQKLVIEIKQAAKKGQNGPLKVMARDLVRCRNHQSKFLEMKSNMNTIAVNMKVCDFFFLHFFGKKYVFESGKIKYFCFRFLGFSVSRSELGQFALPNVIVSFFDGRFPSRVRFEVLIW